MPCDADRGSEDGKEFRVVCGHGIPIDQGKSDSDRSETLEGIQKENGVSLWFPENPKDIGRTDVSAAVLADVNSASLRDDVSARKGADEIG